jgi:hypothetical protein
MTPAGAIAALDRQLAAHGENVTLTRVGGASVTVRAFVRGYAPDQLVGGISQQDVKIICSPAEIDAAGWPETPQVTAAGDKRIPRRGDMVKTSRGPAAVQSAGGVYIDGTLVRIEIQARGAG